MSNDETQQHDPGAESIPRLSSALRPVPITGAGVLTKRAFRGADLDTLLSSYQARLQGPPDDAGVVLDMSTIFQLAFQRETALEMQAQSIAQQQLFRVVGDSGREPSHGERAETPSADQTAKPLRVLALVAPGDLMVNTPLEFILDPARITLDFLYVVPGQPLPEEIPDHDVAFFAVSEPDENAALLERLGRLAARWPRPLINDPELVLRLARDRVAALLADLPGVVIPPTVRARRIDLEALGRGEAPAGLAESGLEFPLLVRPIGSHAGSGLELLNTPDQIERYLASTAAAQFYLMSFLDYRGADGLYRKYRIVFIEGTPYLCHMAVSENWMIHYLNAGMTESEAKRTEEANAMARFDEEFAGRHRAALEGVSERLGLEYSGIDCGETPDGKLLVFEADVAMVIHDMDPPDLFPYKGPQMRKVFAAFERMLRAAAERS